VSTGYRQGEALAKVGEQTVCAHDLIFDRQGGFCSQIRGPRRERIQRHYTQRRCRRGNFSAHGYNGIGLSPDEATVYAAETFTGRLIARSRRPAGGRRPRHALWARPRTPSSTAWRSRQRHICVASIADGITTLSPARLLADPLPDRMVTNICFGGSDLRDAFVTSRASPAHPHTLPEAG